mmetsp:Transcript_21792/g.32402  ORF Transcript_21792/g.32402 Transcript_21792/m.32402 type:complete len:887 (-) Transcript_21792:457-3117(-)
MSERKKRKLQDVEEDNEDINNIRGEGDDEEEDYDDEDIEEDEEEDELGEEDEEDDDDVDDVDDDDDDDDEDALQYENEFKDDEGDGDEEEEERSEQQEEEEEGMKRKENGKQGSAVTFAPGLPPMESSAMHKSDKEERPYPQDNHKNNQDTRWQQGADNIEEEDEDEEDLEEEKERFYAVRHGRNGVTACIFLYWEDCWTQISKSPNDNDDSKIEYEAFQELNDAINYVRIGKQLRTEQEKHKPKSKRKSSAGSAKKTPPNNSTSTSDAYQKWEDRWEIMYQQLIEYKNERGDCLVQTGRDQKEELRELGRWVARQRKNYKDFTNHIGQPQREELRIKSRTIWSKRFQKLEAIGFSFNAREASTKKRKEEFIREKGITANAVDEKKLKRMMRREYNVKRRKRVDRKYSSWSERFEDLKEYKRKYGTIDVDSDWETPNGGGCRSTLGRWVQVQRRNIKLYRQGDVEQANIDEDRIKQLIELGLDVRAGKRHKYRRRADAEKIDESWDDYYQQLKQYFHEHDTSNVRAKPYTPLRGWVVKQRREYELLKEGKPSDLTAERMAKLSEVKFTFATQKVLYTFEERLEQLKSYREDHGHIVVPRFAKGYGQGLGKWVQQQRVKYKLNKKGNYTTLTPERQQKLEEIGMVWSILKPAQHRAERQPWDIRYEQFLEFKRENGHTIVPQHYPELGNWVNQQRVHYKLMKQGRESLMTPEKALKLADAGFVFHVKGRKNKTPLDEYPQPQPKQPPSPSSSKNDEPKEKQQLKKSSTSSSSPPPSTASPSNSTSSPLSSSSSSKMTSTVGGLPHHHLVIPQLAQQPHTAAAAVAAAEERQKLSALKEELQSRQAATATPTSAFLHQPHHGLTPHQQQQLSQLHQLQQQQQQPSSTK